MMENLKKATSLILFVLILFLFYKTLKVFLVSIAWALVFSVAFNPLSNYFSSKLKRENWGILLTTLIFVLIILLPITFFITKLSVEIYSFTPEILKQISKNGSQMEKYYLEAKKILDTFGISLGEVTNFFASKISNLLQKLFKNLFMFFFHLFFTVIFFFLFLKYKDFFKNLLIGLIPFSQEIKENLLEGLEKLIKAIFYGIFLTSIIQTAFALLGFFIFKVPVPLFFGTLIFIFSFIPIGGSSIVWIPLSLYLTFAGDIKSGIFLFIWCLILVSTLDNFIRPFLVSKKFKANTFFIFVSILGGVSFLGGLGIFYGPLIVFLTYKILENLKEFKIK